MMYYILQKDLMQIMNLDKLAKDLWWGLIAFKTLNALPDSVMFVDNKGEIKQYNQKAKEVFGLNYEEFKTVGFDEIIKDGMSVLIKSADESKPVLCTASIPGREFYVEVNVSKCFGGYCVTIRDLTKLTKEIVNEEKTQRFNDEKNVMLAKLEGDIKSPITSISGFSRGLLDGLGGDLTEKQTKYVKIINNNADELYEFMDKLLEFSKAESSIYESNYHNFDIIETLKAVSKDFEQELTNKKLAFDIDSDNLEKRNVYCDSKAIKDLYRNILEVAVSMTETGYILVKLSHLTDEDCLKYNINQAKAASFIHITIKDTGSGVAEEDMKYLCEPYAQLEKGKKNFLRALKLGTASILVKRTNGFISIKSEVMKGTKYDIILPAEKE